MIQHDDIACRCPRRREEQSVIRRQKWLLCNEDIPSSKHRGELVVTAHSFVRVSLLRLANDAWAIRVHEQFSGSKRDECAVDVHRVLVLEIEHVNCVFGTQVSSEPLNAKFVSNLTSLAENVLSDSCKLGGVEHWLKFSCDKVVCRADFKLRFGHIEIIRHLRLRCGGPFSAYSEFTVTNFRIHARRTTPTFVEILLDELAVRPILKEARPPRHRSFDDFVSHYH
jgi:hypothetical protein